MKNVKRFEVRPRQYNCHPETCSHEEHNLWGVWDSVDKQWVDGSDDGDEALRLAQSYADLLEE